MTTKTFTITNGPSKYDLLISFFEKKEVCFEKQERESRAFSVTRKAMILGMSHAVGASNTVILQLEIIDDSEFFIKTGEIIYGHYNYNMRLGELYFDKDMYLRLLR